MQMALDESGYMHRSTDNIYLIPFTSATFRNFKPTSLRDTKGFKSNYLQMYEKLRNKIKLNYIKSLQNDWDGYGSESFSETLIIKSKDIIEKLDKQPELFPTGVQSISMEYLDIPERYLEFEIFEEYIKVCKVSDIEEEYILDDDNINTINRLVNDFYG